MADAGTSALNREQDDTQPELRLPLDLTRPEPETARIGFYSNPNSVHRAFQTVEYHSEFQARDHDEIPSEQIFDFTEYETSFSGTDDGQDGFTFSPVEIYATTRHPQLKPRLTSQRQGWRDGRASKTPCKQRRQSRAAVVARLWFSNIDNISYGEEQYDIDDILERADLLKEYRYVDFNETYRLSLCRSLYSQFSDEPLPSTEFLVSDFKRIVAVCFLTYREQKLCIHAYFARFNPAFPILHAPTFRPSLDNNLLLLAVCSLGSLFIGSAKAAREGVRIFERLIRAIHASVGFILF